MLGFGCYNGLVGVWDSRENTKRPCRISEVDNSHHEPVVDLIWMSSKASNEFITCSTDGQVCWWDTTNMSEPKDILKVYETNPKTDPDHKLIGATTLEYVSDCGPKYLIGTEKGSIMSGYKRQNLNATIYFNTSWGVKMGRHLGPVYSIKRNHALPNYFMSVGDWSVSVKYFFIY